MCSSTSFQLVGAEVIELKKKHKCMAVEQFHEASKKKERTKERNNDNKTQNRNDH